jgi:hypothetical protein
LNAISANVATPAFVKPTIQRRRWPAPGSSLPISGVLIIDATDIAIATLPVCTSEKSCRATSSGPIHSPRSAMNAA